MQYQWEIEFCYCGSKKRDLVQNLQQNHSSFCDTINMCKTNLFVFSNLIPRVSWLSGRKMPFFISKNPTCPGKWGCVFSYSMKIELQLLTQVSPVTKKNKKWMSKKSKKTKKKLKASLKSSSIYPSSEWLHDHPFHGDGWRRENRGNKVPWGC